MNKLVGLISENNEVKREILECNCGIAVLGYRWVFKNSLDAGLFCAEINKLEELYKQQILNQPERSKREDSQECEMRCSEHCGNTVRGK